jgi:hypothetical protein
VLATNTSGASATLVGYLDWNRNGAFDDNTNEETAPVTVANGTTNHVFAVTWTGVPANCGNTVGSTDITYARFRLASSAAEAQAPTGLAATGEVEDYRLDGGTLPVTVASLSATRDGGRVRFDWTTATEVGNVGFNVYGKTPAGTWQRLNPALIPAEGGGLEPRRYSVVLGAPAGVTEFFIEDIDRTGVATGHRALGMIDDGPQRVAPSSPARQGGGKTGPGDA